METSVELQLIQHRFTHEFVSDLQELSEDAFGKTKRAYIEWRIDDIATADDRFVPREIARHLRDILEGHLPIEPIDVGI